MPETFHKYLSSIPVGQIYHMGFYIRCLLKHRHKLSDPGLICFSSVANGLPAV